MIRHLLNAIIFVSITGVFCAVCWVAFGYVRHVHRVVLMMGESGYGYRDSAYLVRRVTRQRLGKPGMHRQSGPDKQKPLALVSAEPIPDEPVMGDPTTVPVHEWPLNDRQADTDLLPVTDPASTATMTIPGGVPVYEMGTVDGS